MINCTQIDSNRDSKCYEYNKVLHVELKGGVGYNVKIGKVTIHLHHTKRLLQLQGSAKMPSGEKAPVWFLNTFIKNRFIQMANIKKYDVKMLNDAVIKAVEGNQISAQIIKSCTKW